MGVVGKRVGRVRVEALIARGGIGEVYRGFDEVLQRPVALKSIRSEHRMTALVRARFLREARLLSKLDHPHICRIYDIISEEHCDYLVLELIEGETLRQAFHSEFKLDDKLRIAEEIAEALDYAHQRQVLHRDLKPDNVMLTPNGGVKILDFGLARTFEEVSDRPTASPLPLFEKDHTDKTIQGTIIGTLRFMSPEQAAGDSLTAASDVYSFGLILQQLVTGNSAYESNLDGVALYDEVRKAKTIAVEGTDPDLARLIEWMKKVEPDQRPAAQEVVHELKRIRRKPQAARQNMRRAAGVIVLLLVISATAFFSRKEEPASLKPGQEGRIAMLPFANQTGEAETEWITFGLMDMVAETLDKNPQIEVLPRETVLQAARKNRIEQNAELTADQVTQLCRIVGSQYLAVGTVKKEGELYHLTYTLYDVRGLRSSGKITGMELTNMANALSAALNQRLVPDSLIPDIQETYSTSEIANQTYAAGLQRLSTAGPLVAENYFKVSLDLDPDFMWAEKKLAECKERLTQWDESEKILKKVLAESRKRNERKVEADTLRSLGVISNHKKDYAAAEKLWRSALAVTRGLKSPHGEARILNNLAVSAMNRDDYWAAEKLFQESLLIKRRIGDRIGEAFTLNNLSVIAYHLKHPELEEKYALESLRISREIRDLESQAYTMGNLGDAYRDRGDFKRALDLQKQAWELYRKMADKEGEGIASYGIALIYLDQENVKDAEPFITSARNWYKDDPRMLILDAQSQFVRKNFVSAFNLMQKAKDQGADWSERQEATLKKYREVAKQN